MTSTLYKKRIQIAILALILLDIVLVVYSCQHRTKMNPVEGDLFPKLPDSRDQVYEPPIYVTGDADQYGIITAGTGSFGAYRVLIDTRNSHGEIVPIRSGQAVGDEFIVDITNYLNGSPCSDCFRIESVGLNPLSELEVEFSIRHPFPIPDRNPPGERDRLDLHVFDLQAIFFASDTGQKIAFPSISTTVGNPIGDISTLEADNSGFWASQNWDGFTDHFSDYVSKFFNNSANLNPYIIFFEDSSTGNFNPDSDNGFTNLYRPSGHNVFPQGGGPEFHSINFGSNPGNQIEFVVLLSAAYGQSAKFWGNEPGQRGNPRYFLPEFNRKEPWKVQIDIPSDTDLLESRKVDSSTILNVSVYDWQHNLGTVTGEYDPYTASLDSIKRSSQIQKVVVEIPGVNNLVESTKAVTGTGVADDPLVFEIEISNALGAMNGKYTGLVAVVDELHGTYLGGYGVERDGVTTFGVNRFATYATFSVNVVDRGGGSFSTGFSMYGGENGSSPYYIGDEILLDSVSANSIAVHGNTVYIVGSILNAPNGDSWDVYLMRSTDGGMTFEYPRILNNDYAGAVAGNQNQPTISVAEDTGHVYVAFTDISSKRIPGDYNQVVVRRSIDNGLTFSSPGNIINTLGGSSDSAVIETGVSGKVWVAYRNRFIQQSQDTQLVFCTSNDYGQSFQVSWVEASQPTNHSNPIVVTGRSMVTPSDNLVLIWRQQNLYSPDIRYSVSGNGGISFSPSVALSDEMLYQHATLPRATMDMNGNIYCVYRVSHHDANPTTVRIAYGARQVGNQYIWQSIDIKKELDHLFGDLDVFVTNGGSIFVCWNQLDDANTYHGQDVFVYKSSSGTLEFEEYARVSEPTGFFADQDMPRFTGNQSGKIFMVYRDNTYNHGGELFFTHGYE